VIEKICQTNTARQTTLDEFEGLRECIEDLEKTRKAYKEMLDRKV